MHMASIQPREESPMPLTHIYLLDPGSHRPDSWLGDRFRDIRAFGSLDSAKAAIQAHVAEPIEWHGSNPVEFLGAFHNDDNWPDVQIWRVEVE